MAIEWLLSGYWVANEWLLKFCGRMWAELFVHLVRFFVSVWMGPIMHIIWFGVIAFVSVYLNNFIYVCMLLRVFSSCNRVLAYMWIWIYVLIYLTTGVLELLRRSIWCTTSKGRLRQIISLDRHRPRNQSSKRRQQKSVQTFCYNEERQMKRLLPLPELLHHLS